MNDEIAEKWDACYWDPNKNSHSQVLQLAAAKDIFFPSDHIERVEKAWKVSQKKQAKRVFNIQKM